MTSHDDIPVEMEMYDREPGRCGVGNPGFVDVDGENGRNAVHSVNIEERSSRVRRGNYNSRSRLISSSSSSSSSSEDEQQEDEEVEVEDAGSESGLLRGRSSNRFKPHAERVNLWNVFETKEHSSTSERVESFFKVSTQWLKIGTYLFLGVGVVILNMLSKGSLLLAASNLRPPHGASFNDVSNQYLYCQNYSQTINNNGTLSWNDFALCVMRPRDKLPKTTPPGGSQTTPTLSNDTLTSGVTPAYSTANIIINATTQYRATYPCPPKMTSTNEVGEPYYAQQCSVYRGLWAWSLFIILTAPSLFVFARCAWRVTFKETSNPTWKALVAAATFETVHTVGSCVFTFIVLPSADNVILGLLLMLCVSVVPSLMLLFSARQRRRRHMKNWVRAGTKVFDCLSVLGQLSACVAWPIITLSDLDKYDKNLIWAIPLSLICISVRWWENFLEKPKKPKKKKPKSKESSSIDDLARLGYRERLSDVTWNVHNFIWNMACEIYEARIRVDLILSLWKILLSFGLMIGMVGLQLNDWNAVFSFDSSSCNANDGVVTSHQVWQMELDWLWVWLTSVCSSLVCYFFIRSAAKIRIQRLAYALPLALTTPTMFIALSVMCSIWNDGECAYTSNNKAGYLFFRCYHGGYWNAFNEQIWWAAIIWWFSQIWVTVHVWFSLAGRLDPADKLFILPLYDGVLLEQSFLLNRTRNERRKKTDCPHRLFQEQNDAEPTARPSRNNNSLDTPLIYICATMWHESREEMITMLNSIFKLDRDQAARRNLKTLPDTDIPDLDFYEFEGHIFFDNAMETHEPSDHDYRTNSYVRCLVSVVETAAKACHGEHAEINPPERTETPYGGRLVWTMPGGNKIIVHLKDSAKIRHKKRWSQVLYMYYFLGYKLWAEQRSLNDRAKKRRAENTFLMALDGDVDFEPKALAILVDLMKRNKGVGAACGRIHPTGSGPVVWYQKFEYALGHWMQKATEHVIGCVLCSPGCFSLFRGSALMDDNVMHKYTTKPTEPLHYIQYDQGEDRWLCTLLLQQGYRVEYAAASDSYTCAPEDLNTLLNQRRRWMPSTMANIWDLLMSCFKTTAANENISVLYIIYQYGLFFASIVGPGTILMMIIGAVQLALKIDFVLSAILNFIPVIIFILLCYLAPEKVQLGAASFLSLLYCLVQIIVLIGLIVQMARNELLYCDPNAMFFLLVSGTFILCGILHPREILALFCGIVYYLSIPTMYMILMIYSMCNLHIVSWGTREVKKSPAELERERQAAEQKAAEEAAKSKKKSGKTAQLGSHLSGITGVGDDGWRMQCGSCCKMLCCLPETSNTQKEVEYKLIVEKMNGVERTLTDLGQRLSETFDDEYTSDDDDDDDADGDDMRYVDATRRSVGRRSVRVVDNESAPVESGGVTQKAAGRASRLSFNFHTKPGVVVESKDKPAAEQETDWTFPGYTIHNVAADGECAFSAIAHQLQFHNYVLHPTGLSGHSVRQDIVAFIRNNTQCMSTINERLSGITIEKYLKDMAVSTMWADENVFYAASMLYDLEICIHTCDGMQPKVFGFPVASRSISLGYVAYVVGGSPTHYVSLIPCEEYFDDYNDWDEYEDTEEDTKTEPWIEDYELGNGKITQLPENEKYFFQDLITEYLEPLVEDKEQTKQLSASLLTLRNRVSAGFLFVNGLFVVSLFAIQLWTEDIGIPWFCPGVKLDPLGLTFMIVFGVIIVIQVIGMLIHRTGTFLHLMSLSSEEDLRNTDIECQIAAAIELGRLDITEELPPDRPIPPASPPPAPPGSPPSSAAAQPEISDTRAPPRVKRRRRRRCRDKGMTKTATRSRAVSRTVPTIEEAFKYQVEKMRRMTPGEVDHFIRAQTASSVRNRASTRSISAAIHNVHRRVTQTTTAGRPTSPDHVNGGVGHGNHVTRLTDSQNDIDEEKCLVFAETVGVGRAAATDWSDKNVERRATTSSDDRRIDVGPTSPQVDRHRIQRKTVACGPFERQPGNDDRRRRKTEVTRRVQFANGDGETSARYPDSRGRQQWERRSVSEFEKSSTVDGGGRDGRRRKTDAVRVNMQPTSSGRPRSRSIPASQYFDDGERRALPSDPDYWSPQQRSARQFEQSAILEGDGRRRKTEVVRVDNMQPTSSGRPRSRSIPPSQYFDDGERGALPNDPDYWSQQQMSTHELEQSEKFYSNGDGRRRKTEFVRVDTHSTSSERPRSRSIPASQYFDDGEIESLPNYPDYQSMRQRSSDDVEQFDNQETRRNTRIESPRNSNGDRPVNIKRPVPPPKRLDRTRAGCDGAGATDRPPAIDNGDTKRVNANYCETEVDDSSALGHIDDGDFVGQAPDRRYTDADSDRRSRLAEPEEQEVGQRPSVAPSNFRLRFTSEVDNPYLMKDGSGGHSRLPRSPTPMRKQHRQPRSTDDKRLEVTVPKDLKLSTSNTDMPCSL